MNFRAAAAAALLLSITACTTEIGTRAAEPSPTASAPPITSSAATPRSATITPACRSKVSAMLLEGLAGEPLPTVRPEECSGLNDAQWVELAAEQSRRLAEVSGGTAGSAATAPAEEPAVTQVTFKVWGKAPSGTTITYGSDSQNLEGSGLPMTRTLKFKADALYYHLTAQLQGGGDIHCSVTLGSQTKEGQARGGYNICSAQINLL